MKKTVEKLTLKHRRPDVFNLLKELGCEYIGIEEVPIEKIMIDQGIYPREKTDKERVSLYTSNILNGDLFPPILTSADYTKLDGNHRYYAHKEAGKTTIWIEKWEVPEGLYPVVAQAVNTEEKDIDTPLTPTEKKRAILRDWEILSQYDKKTRKQIIAKVLRTSPSYVDKVLSEAGIIKSEKEELKRRAKDLYNQGYSIREIANELNQPKSTVADWVSENLPSKKSDTTPEGEEENNWDDWNEEVPAAEEKQKTKQKKEKELLPPTKILERNKDIIWDALIEIEFHFGLEKALEIAEEFYFALKEKTYKDMEDYKDRKALFDFNRLKGRGS